MWTLFKEAVRAETVTQVEVLPGCTLGRCAAGDRLSIDKHLDRTYVPRKIASVVVCLGEGRRRNARVVLGRLGRTMPQPGLQLEQRHWLLGVVELAGDRGPSAMAGDPPARIFHRYAAFTAQQRNQGFVEVEWRQCTTTPGEQQRDALASLAIDEEWLWPALLLPIGNDVADERINRFGVTASGLVCRHVKQAGRGTTRRVVDG